jgi:hypothetical protein
MFDDDADFSAERITFKFGDSIEVKFFDEFSVDVGLEGFKVSGCLANCLIGSDHWGLFAGLNRHAGGICGLNCAVYGTQPFGPYAAERL